MGDFFFARGELLETGDRVFNPAALGGGEAFEKFSDQAVLIGVDFGVDDDTASLHILNGGQECGGLAAFEFLSEAADTFAHYIKNFVVAIFIGREQNDAQGGVRGFELAGQRDATTVAGSGRGARIGRDGDIDDGGGQGMSLRQVPSRLFIARFDHLKSFTAEIEADAIAIERVIVND